MGSDCISSWSLLIFLLYTKHHDWSMSPRPKSAQWLSDPYQCLSNENYQRHKLAKFLRYVDSVHLLMQFWKTTTKFLISYAISVHHFQENLGWCRKRIQSDRKTTVKLLTGKQHRCLSIVQRKGTHACLEMFSRLSDLKADLTLMYDHLRNSVEINNEISLNVFII